MINNILPKTQTVYEFAFSVHNHEENDTQNLIAAFLSLPTVEKWETWLSGWNSAGYYLASQPKLMRVI